MNRPSPDIAGDDARFASRLARGFGALVVLTTGLIVLGALVRAHGAGLACPDWPLCFGEFVPAFDLKVAFEWTHRLVAGSISLLFVALGLAIASRPATRSLAGRLWIGVAGVLAVQVLLGALTVWHLLAQWTVTSHLVTGNAFNAGLLWLALRLRDAAPDASGGTPRRVPGGAPRRAPDGARIAVGVAAALLVLQIVLGGLVSSSYAGLACPDWPTCLGGAWFPTWRGPIGLHLAHRTNGYALLLALGAAAVATRRTGGLGRLCALGLGVGALQVAVGVANVWLHVPVEVTALHSALAAALVLLLTAAVRRAFGHPAR